MSPVTVHPESDDTGHEPVMVIRRAIDTLNALDRETADHLNALALVLMRVARADGRVCGDERLRMESILVEDAGVSPEHAALVTEIACHRERLTDCGSAYAVSRGIRSRLDREKRASIIALLAAVARADGCFCPLERHEVMQITGELGISPGEIETPTGQS